MAEMLYLCVRARACVFVRVRVCQRVCVCEREREGVCVCVCVKGEVISVTTAAVATRGDNGGYGFHRCGCGGNDSGCDGVTWPRLLRSRPRQPVAR